MDRFDFYFEQLVTQADMDEAFDFAESADQALQSDNGYVGIVQGLEVNEAFPTPNLTADIPAGVAYDQVGQRCFVSGTQNLDLSVDSNSVPTTVAGVGNEKWLSIFIAFDRALSDPRVDGNGVPLQYRREESFQFIVDQGAESAAGSPAVYTSTIAEAYTIGAGQTLDLSVDGGAPVTVTFAGTETTAAQVAAAIQAQVPGVTAADNGGFVEITTNGTGPGASLLATGGDTLATFGFPLTAAVGAGGPTRPALRPDAILLADVLIKFGTTAVVDLPPPAGTDGYIDTVTRRQTVFAYDGLNYKIRAGTITDFADGLSDQLNTHVSNAGNAHPASAITFDGGPIPGVWSNLKVSPEVQTALLGVTQDLADTSPGSDGAGLVGVGLTGTDITPGTLEFVLAALDSLKGSLGNPNTWTAINDFNARVDANAGLTVTEDLRITDGAFFHSPEDLQGNNDWTFGDGFFGSNAPIRKYGKHQQHTLGAGVTTSQTLLYDGGGAPVTTVVGAIRGSVLYWDDNSNPVDATHYTFEIAFNLSAGVGQTVNDDASFDTPRLLNGGADDNISISTVTPAGTGELYLSIGWGANAGLIKNIVTMWELVFFSSNQ